MNSSISASLIVVILVGGAVGALIGFLFGDVVTNGSLLAILAALVGNAVAAVTRYKLVFVGSRAGGDESRIPGLVAVNGAIAAVAGGLAGHNLAVEFEQAGSAVWVGTLAGLFGAILMAMLMIAYHYIPHHHAR